MELFSNIHKEPLKSPNSIVPAVDTSYVFQKTAKLIMKPKADSFHVEGYDKNTYFKIEQDFSKYVCVNMMYEPIINIRHGFGTEVFEIYIGDKDKTLVASVHTCVSLSSIKFDVEFTNLATNSLDLFQMIIINNYYYCCIYYGKKNEGGPLVCKIKRVPSILNFEYEIEIAPGVDNMLMLGLARCYIGLFDLHRDRQRRRHH